MGQDIDLYGKPEWFKELEDEHPELVERLLDATRLSMFDREFDTDIHSPTKLKDLDIVDSEIWVVNEYSNKDYFWEHENLMSYYQYEDVKDKMVRDI